MDGEKHNISIIIPLYNVKKYLHDCITSLNNQSYKNFEVVFVNDGSTDGTLQLINLLTKNFNFSFKLLSTENKGVASARNTALDVASGDYIVFIDADDYFDTDYFKNLYECIKDNNTDCAICGYTKVNEMHNMIKKSQLPEKRLLQINNSDKTILEQVEINNFDSQITCSMIRRDILVQNNIKFTEGCSYGEDSEFMQKVFININSVSHTGLRGYYYVIRNSSTTKKKAGMKRLDSLYAFKRTISYISANAIKFDEKILTKMHCRKILNLLGNFIKENNSQLYFQLVKDIESRQILLKEIKRTESKKQKIIILMILKAPKIYYRIFNFLYNNYSLIFLKARVKL